MKYGQDHLERIRKIRIFETHERRAPHKPLLLLIAIARLLRGERQLAYGDIEEALLPLLKAHAPPVRARHQPELPYWHLQTDGLWVVPGADDFERQKGGFPRMSALRASSGHLDPAFADALAGNLQLVEAIVAELLDSHFPESLHEDIEIVSLSQHTARGRDSVSEREREITANIERATEALEIALGRYLNWLFELRGVGDYGATEHAPEDQSLPVDLSGIRFAWG